MLTRLKESLANMFMGRPSNTCLNPIRVTDSHIHRRGQLELIPVAATMKHEHLSLRVENMAL
jgi:hypothetical protein